MTKEQYVSFETSQLLKEKGFAWETVWHYYINVADESIVIGKPYYWITDDKLFPRPTIQMALRWLKETHGLWVVSIPCPDGGFYFTIYKRCGKIWKDNVYDHTEYENFDEPECAVESGINYSLIHLIYDEGRTD